MPMQPDDKPTRGFLAWVERIGNRLPEPAMIFAWLILALVILSQLGSWLGWQAQIAYSGDKPPPFAELGDGTAIYRATSLLAEENVHRLLTELPRTLVGFAPLGAVITMILAATIAERSGLLSVLIRASLRRAPARVLTPLVAVIGMVSHHASDAAYIVFIPLAGLLYAVVGRHPLAGIAAAIAAVSGGHAGNVTPGQMDVILFSFTQEAARIVDPGWTMNPAGNWWFILTIVAVFTPIIWFLTDRVVEPRLGRWTKVSDAELERELASSGLSDEERRGLRRAGWWALGVIALFVALTVTPGYSPLADEAAQGSERYNPLFAALIALFFLLLAGGGILFGTATGLVRSSRDALDMAGQGVIAMAPYIVFVFFAAHFVAMFSWSRLGPILAISGAHRLEALALPAPVLLVSVQMLSSFLDLFIGSASAKWSALAPVVVPMFMLLGISPEMTTAAYRMGDSYTNIMTPLMSYFPLVLAYCRRWMPDTGVGTLLALMLPFALTFMGVGVVMVASWVAFDLPLGPGATVGYSLPLSR